MNMQIQSEAFLVPKLFICVVNPEVKTDEVEAEPTGKTESVQAFIDTTIAAQTSQVQGDLQST